MIAARYRALLQHLGTTLTLGELEQDAGDGIGLRHDIDHDLGVALDMSRLERAAGARATYFILHNHAYCKEPRFLDRLRQLVDDGHEIGLHLDAIGAWWRCETDSPIDDLARWLDGVRGAGIEVVASAAHGARACYEGGFANHWIWSELRGDDPASTMDGISAEGVPEKASEFRLAYPPSHRISRPDGEVFDLWSGSLAAMGLRYEACTIPVDGYWSDSGGSWRRSPDPMEHEIARGRHQVLVHPWWWREPRRSTLLLSTARCGTKWLCDRIAARTSATVLHERSLNQAGATLDPVVGLKRTAGDLVGLLEDRAGVGTLVKQALAGQAASRRDVVEANVYLPHVEQDLLVRDDVSIVHLHRDPAAVVRSILQRGWYDTPDDRRHPQFDLKGWDRMDRVTRACTYWAETNRRLLAAHPDAPRIAVEDLQQDPERLQAFIEGLGFVIHPIPASTDARDAGVRDATDAWTVPPVSSWNDRDRGIFIDVCGPVAGFLGRTLEVDEPKGRRHEVLIPVEPSVDSVVRPAVPIKVARGHAHRCNWEQSLDRREVRIKGEAGRGAWFGLASKSGWRGGLPARKEQVDALGQGWDLHVEGRFEATVDEPSFGGRLFAIGCDASGAAIDRRELLKLVPDEDGRLGGAFSLRFDNPSVASAFGVVLVDRSDAAWLVYEPRLVWREPCLPKVDWEQGRTHRCVWSSEGPDGLMRIEGGSGRGAWFGLNARSGWDGGRPTQRQPGELLVEGRFEANVEEPSFVGRLFVIGCDSSGEVMDRRPALRLERDKHGKCGGAFAVRFTNPAVASAFGVVLVDRTDSDWCLRPQAVSCRSSFRPANDIKVRDRLADDSPTPIPSREESVSECFTLDPAVVSEHRARHERRRLYEPEDYEFLLSDFKDHEKITLHEYAKVPDVGDRRILLIRHDVDHDIETALGMARWEADRGIRSTYCLLHTAWYWGEFDGRRYRHTRELVEAGDRLLELGHEINFHNNLATLALKTGCDPARVLDSELEFMRSRGWPVVGTSTHGDRLCGNLGYRNFEIFEHAVKDEFGGRRLVWHEGNGVRLGSLRQEDFGLSYEAYDIHRDVYVSDSGGRLRCPLDAPGRRTFGRNDPGRGHVAGLLMHPIWWRFPSGQVKG